MREISKQQYRTILNELFIRSSKIDINILLKDNSWIKGKVKDVKESTLEIANKDEVYVFEIDFIKELFISE